MNSLGPPLTAQRYIIRLRKGHAWPGGSAVVQCPECAVEIDLDEDEVEEGEILNCPECEAELEVVQIHPVHLNVISEDDDDDDEEDDEDDDEDDEEEEAETEGDDGDVQDEVVDEEEEEEELFGFPRYIPAPYPCHLRVSRESDLATGSRFRQSVRIGGLGGKDLNEIRQGDGIWPTSEKESQFFRNAPRSRAAGSFGRCAVRIADRSRSDSG